MKYFLPLLALGLAACSEDAGSDGPTAGISDSAGVSIAYSVLGESPSQCVVSPQPLLEIGDESSGDAYILYYVTSVGTLSDGRIVVLNTGTDEVRVFSPQGHWLYSFGQLGNGPGEFQPPFGASGMWIGSGDTIRVANANPWRYEVFSADGAYQETVSVPTFTGGPRFRAVLSDGASVLGNPVYEHQDIREWDFSPTYADLLFVDNRGLVVDTVASIRGPEDGKIDTSVNVSLSPMFVASSHIDGMKDRFVVGWSGQQEFAVYKTVIPNRPAQIIRWETIQSREVSQDEISAEKSRIMDLRDQSSNKAYYDERLHPDRPIADQFPAFRTLKLGRDLRVWLAEFRRPTDGMSNNWMVFSPEGLFECQIDLPPRFTPHEFGPDYILGVLREEDGAEKVVRYALSAPQPAL